MGCGCVCVLECVYHVHVCIMCAVCHAVVYAYMNELALNIDEQTLPLVVLAAIAGKSTRHTSSISEIR